NRQSIIVDSLTELARRAQAQEQNNSDGQPKSQPDSQNAPTEDDKWEMARARCAEAIIAGKERERCEWEYYQSTERCHKRADILVTSSGGKLVLCEPHAKTFLAQDKHYYKLDCDG